MNLFDSKKKLGIAGVVMGLVAATLAYFGNPANMAICVACFVRDTAGALGLHSAEPVQYARPEIIGIVLGAFIISIATKEYRATAGSSTIVRFVLGMILVIGALVFLGCPLRMVIRMSAGDLNAWVALIGFALGVATGVFALKKGFSLGRAHVTNKVSGSVLPLLMIGVLVLALGTNLLKSSTAGPGSMHAPIIISLIGGLLFGAFAQKSRMCFAGSIRDIILMKNFDLITIIVGFFAVMLVYNVATGHFVLAFNTPGVIAHSQHLWSILGMYAVGFAAVLAGGCPLRQLVLAGQGSSDAGVTVIGMFAGGALAHNLGLAASGTALNAETGEIVAGAVLDHLAAGLYCFAVWQNDGQRPYKIPCYAVFYGTHAAGVGRYISAYRCGFFARIGRIKQPVLLDKFRNLHKQHARLDRHGQIACVKLQYLIHTARAEHYSAVQRNSRPHKSRARAAHDHRQIFSVCVFHHG